MDKEQRLARACNSKELQEQEERLSRRLKLKLADRPEKQRKEEDLDGRDGLTKRSEGLLEAVERKLAEAVRGSRSSEEANGS